MKLNIKKLLNIKVFFMHLLVKLQLILICLKTSIRRKLKDLNQKVFEYINSSELQPQLVNIEKAKPVYVNGVYYRSKRYVSKKTGITRRTLRRHLQSNKHDYCYYA
jgi:hypothetical protein